METRVALIGIIVENSESTAQLNALLHKKNIIERYRRSCRRFYSIGFIRFEW